MAKPDRELRKEIVKGYVYLSELTALRSYLEENKVSMSDFVRDAVLERLARLTSPEAGEASAPAPASPPHAPRSGAPLGAQEVADIAARAAMMALRETGFTK